MSETRLPWPNVLNQMFRSLDHGFEKWHQQKGLRDQEKNQARVSRLKSGVQSGLQSIVTYKNACMLDRIFIFQSVCSTVAHCSVHPDERIMHAPSKSDQCHLLKCFGSFIERWAGVTLIEEKPSKSVHIFGHRIYINFDGPNLITLFSGLD